MFYTVIGRGLDLLIVSLKVGLSLHGFKYDLVRGKVQKQRLQLATYLEMKFLRYLLPFAARRVSPLRRLFRSTGGPAVQ